MILTAELPISDVLSDVTAAIRIDRRDQSVLSAAAACCTLKMELCMIAQV